MRAGRKTEAETGKTRPCIVYVKNLKESRTSSYSTGDNKTAKTLRSKLAISTTTTPSSAVKALPKRRAAVAASTHLTPTTPTTTASATTVTGRAATRSAKAAAPTPLPPPPPTKKQSPAIERLSKRRNTTVNLTVAAAATSSPATPSTKKGFIKRRATQTEDSASKTKMFKSLGTKTVAAASASDSPPPTIAASRSRRSIKPNPKYASEDMVMPKYVASALASDSPHAKRAGAAGKQAQQFFDDDDDDEGQTDEEEQLLDEDSDDEIADAAFNPQLHKSDEDDDDDDDDDDESEEEFAKKAPPVKRGRGRPPKTGISSASASSSTPQAVKASAGASASAAGTPAARSNPPTQLQMLRRTMAVNISRGNAGERVGAGGGAVKTVVAAAAKTAAMRPVIGAGVKRKLPEDPSAGSALRKRIAGEQLGQKSTILLSGPRAAPRQLHQINGAAKKPLTIATAAGTAPAKLKVGGAAAAVAAKQANALTAGTGRGTAASAAASKKADNDEVPTFTIVNINDIINQDDVLITRTTANNNNTKSGGAATTTLSPGTGAGAAGRLKAVVKGSSSSITSKPLIGGGGATQVRPQPRILNVEMGKKAVTMKPLMNMGNELCPTMSTDGETEEEETDLVELDEDREEDDQDSLSHLMDEVEQQEAEEQQQQQQQKSPIKPRRPPTTAWLPRRSILSSTTPVNAQNRAQQSRNNVVSLLSESGSNEVFKKPVGITQSTQLQQQQQTRRSKENETGAEKGKFFPPETTTTTICEEDGRVVKKITCYETWHVISAPKVSMVKSRLERTSLDLPLIKLANVAPRIKVPSPKWTSKVTLYKVSQAVMQRQAAGSSVTLFTGDLKAFNIPEEERHKYQPSCVLFRRSVVDRNKCRVPYDRAIIFKNKSFYANIDGKHVVLLGAPETVSTIRDVEILLDIVDSLSLGSSLVELVTSK